jgi:hypothetical protein
MADSTYKQLWEAQQEFITLGRKLDRARADIVRAQSIVDETQEDYEKARESFQSIAENVGEDVSAVLSVGQDRAVGRARTIAGPNGATTTTRGKNPSSIMKALEEAPGPLAAGILIEKAKANGGGSTASLNQAIGKMFKDGKIKREGTRGKYLYSKA